MKTSGRILHNIMDEEEVTLKELSSRTSCHYNTLLNIYNGVTDTRLTFLEDLCYELGYELTVLIRKREE